MRGWRFDLPPSMCLRLLDSGADGIRNNADDRTFATQGIYIP